MFCRKFLVQTSGSKLFGPNFLVENLWSKLLERKIKVEILLTVEKSQTKFRGGATELEIKTCFQFELAKIGKKFNVKLKLNSKLLKLANRHRLKKMRIVYI